MPQVLIPLTKEQHAALAHHAIDQDKPMYVLAKEALAGAIPKFPQDAVELKCDLCGASMRHPEKHHRAHEAECRRYSPTRQPD